MLMDPASMIGLTYVMVGGTMWMIVSPRIDVSPTELFATLLACVMFWPLILLCALRRLQ